MREDVRPTIQVVVGTMVGVGTEVELDTGVDMEAGTAEGMEEVMEVEAVMAA